MANQNCWEIKKCGREPGGAKVKELGVCPAAAEVRLDGVNCGKNAGRCCWAVAGTLCEGKIQGSFAQKVGSCLNCEFFQLVVKEEGRNYINTMKIIEKLNAQCSSKPGSK